MSGCSNLLDKAVFVGEWNRELREVRLYLNNLITFDEMQLQQEDVV
ncbi:hypothetical protein [Vibrio mangrovi]|uniref:Uncharacterized protein n=1 Tax=Vibrio mangrovi TaxID=474394 RepID=A0ABU4I3A8_9VIBR|nr:hypothetical protein [Vibrio mangrovi]MDW6002409.1 hypothetical protein [Vibrio mangrovi]